MYQQEKSRKCICLCCPLYVAETPKTSIKDHEPPFPNNFWHCQVRFLWTTLLETAVGDGKSTMLESIYSLLPGVSLRFSRGGQLVFTGGQNYLN